jgi:hypothetical protein
LRAPISLKHRVSYVRSSPRYDIPMSANNDKEILDEVKLAFENDIELLVNELTSSIYHMDVNALQKKDAQTKESIAAYMYASVYGLRDACALHSELEELSVLDHIPNTGTLNRVMRGAAQKFSAPQTNYTHQIQRLRATHSAKQLKMQMEMNKLRDKIKDLEKVQVKAPQPVKELDTMIKKNPFVARYTQVANNLRKVLYNMIKIEERINGIRNVDLQSKARNIYEKFKYTYEYLQRNHKELKNLLDSLKVIAFIPVVSIAAAPLQAKEVIMNFYPDADPEQIERIQTMISRFSTSMVAIIDVTQKLLGVPKGNSPLSLTFLLCFVSAFKFYEAYSKNDADEESMETNEQDFMYVVRSYESGSISDKDLVGDVPPEMSGKDFISFVKSLQFHEINMDLSKHVSYMKSIINE